MSRVPDNRGLGAEPDRIEQDGMEVALLEFVMLLSHHAVDCGASGECIVRAQQLLSQQTGPIDLPMPTLMCEPGAGNFYDPVTDSLLLRGVQTHPATCSASPDELVSDILSVVVTAHALAADILGEFGISEPSILRPDGSLNVQRLNAQRRQTVEPWARARDLVAM
jgi:hypothetical protein